MKYTGFYINLDRNADRKQRLEAELSRNGLGGAYTRFPASNGNELAFPNPRLKEGEVGCFTSHYRLLDAHRGHGKPLHVIEDDIIMSPQTGRVLEWAIDGGQLDKFDIVYTDVAVPLLNDACHAYKAYYDATVKKDAAGKIVSATFSVIDMRELIFGSTCSFLVSPRAISKLADLFKAELDRGARLPVDLYIRQLCQEGKITVGCLFPFVTSIRPESCFSSTMEKRFEDMAALASNLLRHSFYVGADWSQCLAFARQAFPQPAENDTHRQIMLRLMGYSLTETYKKC